MENLTNIAGTVKTMEDVLNITANKPISRKEILYIDLEPCINDINIDYQIFNVEIKDIDEKLPVDDLLPISQSSIVNKLMNIDLKQNQYIRFIIKPDRDNNLKLIDIIKANKSTNVDICADGMLIYSEINMNALNLQSIAKTVADKAAQMQLDKKTVRDEAARIKAGRDAAIQEAAKEQQARMKAKQDAADKIEAARIKAVRDAAIQEVAKEQQARLKAKQDAADKIEAARIKAVRDAAIQEVAKEQQARLKAKQDAADKIEAARIKAVRDAAIQEAAKEQQARLKAKQDAADKIEAARIKTVRDAAIQEVAKEQQARLKAKQDTEEDKSRLKIAQKTNNDYEYSSDEPDIWGDDTWHDTASNIEPSTQPVIPKLSQKERQTKIHQLAIGEQIENEKKRNLEIEMQQFAVIDTIKQKLRVILTILTKIMNNVNSTRSSSQVTLTQINDIYSSLLNIMNVNKSEISKWQENQTDHNKQYDIDNISTVITNYFERLFLQHSWRDKFAQFGIERNFSDKVSDGANLLTKLITYFDTGDVGVLNNYDIYKTHGDTYSYLTGSKINIKGGKKTRKKHKATKTTIRSSKQIDDNNKSQKITYRSKHKRSQKRRASDKVFSK